MTRQLEDRRQTGYCSACAIALVYLGLKDHDSAFKWLTQACEEHDPLLAYAANNPMYDPLRSDPRFQALLKKMNFPAQAQG